MNSMLSVVIHPEDSKIVVLPIKDNARVPIFCGILTLKNTPKGVRAGKFRIKQGGKEEFRAPEELIELLRLADKILIAEGNEQSEAGFKQLLGAYQLDYGYTTACRLCLLTGRYNNNNSISFHSESICEECAKKELVREAKSLKIGAHGQERLVWILHKTRNLDSVLAMLSPEKLDSGLTRFDTIEASRVECSIKVKDLPVQPELKKILLNQLEELMPVQSLSVEAGLLDGKNQLIVSATATGKTLIGELAGIQNILKAGTKGKMLFLVPLVALANQKYGQFNIRYSSIATTSLRVGTSRITKGKKGMRTSLSSEIIVGTYEGIDFVIRSGNSKSLGKIATVVIDEVHMLEDKERGHRLDGLIARLKFIAPDAQFIYLSATVGKPKWLAHRLGAELIEFEERPVPIERHLIFAPEYEKKRLMERLARQEYNKKSRKGFRGQTIVFTNSRRNCHMLADALSIKAMPYHAGLSFSERKKVEEKFGKGELPVVVTTAALAAGVDFPASQVIFESLAMGIEWLNVREFQQMLGRAGRPDYHDRGVVVLLADPERRFGKGETEDEIAFRLLNGEIPHFGVDYGEDEMLEETLSNIVVAHKLQDIRRINELLLGNGGIDYLPKLAEYKFIEKTNAGFYPTELGRVVASHFLSVEQAFQIKKAILEGRKPLDIVTELETLNAVYFRYASALSDALGTDIPTRVFGAGLDIVFSADGFSKLKDNLRRTMLDFALEFMTCTCRDSPYCGCAERKFSARLIELCAAGLSPDGIVGELTKHYGVYAYAGDMLGYLDRAARTLEAVELIAEIYGKKEISEKARELRERMEGD